MRRLVRLMLGFLLAILAPACAAAQPSCQLPPAPDQPWAIVGAAVVDAEAGILREDWVVLIEGDRIVAAGPRAGTPIPAGTPVTMAAGRFLAPGLFDTHVHFTDPDVQAPAMVANGVVFVRDLGSATAAAIELREALRSGARLGPELIVTGAIVDGDPPVWPFSEACKDAEAARAAVARLADAGVDQIKVYSRLPADAFRAAVAEAKARGLRVGGHVPDSVSLDEGLAAGMEFSEHLMGWERLVGRLAGEAQDELARGDHRENAYWRLLPQAPAAELDAALTRAARSGAFFAPTLVVLEGVAGYADPDAAERDAHMAYVRPAFRAFWRGAGYQRAAPYFAQALPHQKALVKRLHDTGVTLVCGTDLANPRVYPGFSLHREMELFAECGIPAAAAVRAATITAARLCQVDDRLGRISAGATASFVVLRANPLEDVRNYSRIDAVALRGRWLDRERLDALLAEARAAAAGDAEAEAAAAGSALALRIPGRVIHRGKYVFTFAGQASGHEEFAWTEADDGWHLQALIAPTGGWAKPCEITAHYGKDRRLVAADWRRPDGKETATYRVADGVVHVLSGPAGKEQESSVALDGAKFGPDSFAADFLQLPALGLDTGAKLEDRLFGFGMESWKPTESQRKIQRDADAEVEWGGAKTPVRVYTAEYTMNGQTMKTRTWVGPDGLPIKTAFSLPFGKFEAVREPPRAQ